MFKLAALGALAVIAVCAAIYFVPKCHPTGERYLMSGQIVRGCSLPEKTTYLAFPKH